MLPVQPLSCIYSIVNKQNGKIYIGFTIDFCTRQQNHWRQLRSGKHGNSLLQRAFLKYGESSFEMEMIAECPPHLLASEEHFWCILLNSHDRKYGYNLKPTHPEGKASGYKSGYKHSEEMRKKLSENKLGKKFPKKTTRKCRVKEQMVPVPFIRNKATRKKYKPRPTESIRAGWKHTSEALLKIKERSSQPDNVARIKSLQSLAVTANTGKKRSYEERLKISEGKRSNKNRTIEVFRNADMQLVGTFKMISEASNNLKVGASSIKNNLYGLSSKTTLYTFKFKEVA